MIARIALLGAALVAALAPVPPGMVERLYARGLYPPMQAALSSTANRVTFAWFDVAMTGLAVAVAVIVTLALRAGRSPGGRGAGRPLLVALWRVALVAAAAYLWFLAVWGLNYARPPVDLRLGLATRAVSAAEVETLLARAVDGANADAAVAHAAGFPAPGAVPQPLVDALHAVERDDGRPRPSVPGVPKATLLAAFFRAAGVDGMLAPFVLETLLNPDLTPAERPMVLAHEWAHLSGYAPEADASFTGWRVASRADVASRYSAALFLLSETAGQVGTEVRRAQLARLGELPRRDLQAIAARVEAGRVRVVHDASWSAYDQYLKAQGVREGIQSYSRVVELIIRAGKAG